MICVEEIGFSANIMRSVPARSASVTAASGLLMGSDEVNAGKRLDWSRHSAGDWLEPARTISSPAVRCRPRASASSAWATRAAASVSHSRHQSDVVRMRSRIRSSSL